MGAVGSCDVVFVTPSYLPELSQESIGTLILAETLKQSGFKVNIVRYWQADAPLEDYTAFKSSLLEKILEYDSQIISFYCRCAEYHINVDLARAIKERCPRVIVVFGGPHAELTCEPTLRAFSFIDYICRGEGENTIVPFVRHVLEKGKDVPCVVPGVAYRHDGLIRENPFPTFLPDNYKRDVNYYNLIPDEVLRHSEILGIDVGRGCPFNCIFCCTKTFWKRVFRLRDIDNIIEEIEYVVKNYGIHTFAFEHDLFTTNKERILYFCEKLDASNIQIKWNCSSRLDTINQQLIDRMYESGLYALYFGIESGSERMQDIINKKLNLKRALPVIEYATRKGIDVTTSFIYGFPEETEQDIEDSLRLMFRLRTVGVKNVQIHRLSFDPGTALYNAHCHELTIPTTDPFTMNYHIAVELLDLVKTYPKVFSSFYDYPCVLRETLKHLQQFNMLYSLFPNTMALISEACLVEGVRLFDIYILFHKLCNSVLINCSKAELQFSHYAFLFESFINNIMLDDERGAFSKQTKINVNRVFHLECQWV